VCPRRGREKTVCARGACVALLGGPSTSPLGARLDSRLVSFLTFAAVAAAFLFDTILGIRALGLAEAAVGVYWIRVGRVPYGWRGFPPSGYLTGWAALASGAIAISIGILFMLAPTAVESLVCGHRGCT
jgi:hypothetical protein